MPDLERRVLARGFERVGERRRLAASYGTLLGGIWHGLRAVAGASLDP
jgi:hypothetical protein